MAAGAPVKVTHNKLFIAGEWRDSASGKTFETVNPATEEAITSVAAGTAEDVDAAIAAARAALRADAWRKLSAAARGALLWRIADGLQTQLDVIAELETLDNGKPIFESKYVDVPSCVAVLRYYAGWADKICGQTIPVGPGGSTFAYTLRQPVGVVGAITPWNFPLLLAVWKIAPALAAGNTVVIKPAELTSLSLLAFAEVCREAGLPAGVLNVVPGKGSVVGKAIVEHPGVDKIAFTGSTEVGKGIMRGAAELVKKVSLELGGKSANIIFADADLDAAVKGAYNGIFYGKGEVCAAGSRLLVEASVHEEVVAKLAERTKRLVPGDPLHPKTRLGAIVSKKQMDAVLGHIEKAKQEGSRCVTGGEAVKVNDRGYYVLPTIFDGVGPKSAIAREEVFGPVLAVMPFASEREAVEIANDSVYGLAAGVWTGDLKRAHRVAADLEAGTVWVNTYNFYDAGLPFGGFKQSGFGRELGEAALESYTQLKSVWMDLG